MQADTPPGPVPMTVRVLYFAKSREAAELPEEAMTLPAGSTTSELLARMVALHPRLRSVLTSCVLALNQEYLAHPQEGSRVGGASGRGAARGA